MRFVVSKMGGGAVERVTDKKLCEAIFGLCQEAVS